MNGEQRIRFAEELADLLTIREVAVGQESAHVDACIAELKEAVAQASGDNPDAWELIERGAKRLASRW